MNNPCVIIATHDRLSITTVNIKLLIAQGVKVVLVVSDTNEKQYYDNFDIHVILHANHPLGAKWQCGVDYARQFEPSHIVITGSDDILSKDFFEKYCGPFNYTGFKEWFIYSYFVLYHLKYLAVQPLGGGRIYGSQDLKRRDYKLFDRSKGKLLDDYAFNSSIKSGARWRIIYEPEILAVKGNWHVMNPVDLKHKNVKLISTYEGDEARTIMNDKFNYNPSGGAQTTDRALS